MHKRFLLAFGMAFLLAACVGSDPTRMLVPHPAVDRPATVDPATALLLVNAFRQGSGLPPLGLDEKLTAIAASHARAMAAADKLEHVLPGEGSFQARLAAGGFDAAIAEENIGAGYHDLNEAFSGWRASPHHRDNMLRKGVTLMGIAVAYSPTSKFRDFWSMVLAAPDTHVSGGPPASAR
jgi:uncharacterized protein YkwD